MNHTSLLYLHAFQRGHKAHIIDSRTEDEHPDDIHNSHSPQYFEHIVLDLAIELDTTYPNLTLIIMGNFHHTVSHTALHRMGQHQPPPLANILTPCLQCPLNIVPVILTQYPTLAYHTWYRSQTRDVLISLTF